MIQLKSIHIYPLKSAKGISMGQAKIDDRGFQYDRRWMLVDENGRFMSQRKIPGLALISVELNANSLALEMPGFQKVEIPIIPQTDEKMNVKIWKDTCEAIPIGKYVDELFSAFLGKQCRLVFMPRETIRSISKKYSVNQHSVSFADGFPFLLTSEASLDELNKKLADPLPMNRFRPNLVIAGCEPFAEDNWKKIKIGAILFHVVKPCARCVVTTVDQHTGEKGKEPLNTLAKFRNVNGKLLFGQNLIHEQKGMIRTGEKVVIES